nr:DNA polymerase delta subunit 3-like isoform X2 [Ipomoea batatas]
MAEIETLGILDEIQSLVSDKLQVVSYKWLSQNFLVSSNAAKSLLQEFVEKHGNGVEVVYSLSGWLKNNPSAYHVQLVSSPKLAEAKQEFNENCSIQVYSVQACIPKDPAALWNAEFVQAEELFKQPPVDNCFWDNRFCGVSNSFVKRNAEGTSAITGAPPAKSAGALGVSKSKLTTSQSVATQQPQQKKVQQADPRTNIHSPSMVNDVKNEIPEARGSNLAIDKEKIIQPLAKKKKAQTDKTSAGNGGALANMWGRATTKSKADCISTETNNAIPNSADAQICAREELEDGNSNEDGEDVNIKRYNGKGSRKRRVVFDSSDEEGEDAVNLASPDPPKTRTSMVKQNSNAPELEKALHFEEDEKTDAQLKGESLANMESKNQISSSDILSHGPSNDANTGVKMTDDAPKSPQRKKVLKTRIDERGREVTEVVWEGEEATKPDANLTKKADHKVANDAVDRPPAPKKPNAIGSNAPSNQAAKVGSKKGGNKDPKQGNILSFFKRV